MLARLVGVQVKELKPGCAGAVRDRDTVCVPPFRPADTMTVSFTATAATEAENWTLVWPARTVAPPGTVTFELLDERVMPAFTAAGPVRFTVHVALPAALNAFGVQPSELSTLGAGACNEICVVRVTPLRDAVMFAGWLEAMDPAVTAKVPLDAPAPIDTEPGVPSTALSSDNRTVSAPEAAFVRFTMQLAVCPLFKLVGLQDRDESEAALVSAIEAVWVPPFRLALTITASSAGTPVIVAANCAELCPASTVTEPGVVTFELFSEIATTALVAAAAAKLTVQVEDPAALNAFGEHDRELSTLGAGAAKPIEVERVTPFSTAVIVAVCPEGMEPAVTLKDALEVPAPIVALPGTFNNALFTLKEIVAPPAEGLSNDTLQLAVWPLFRLPGLQVSDERAGRAVSVRFEVCVPPFSVALIVTSSSAGIPATDAANWALLCPARTVTEPGVLTFALPSLIETTAFTAAAAVNDTVQTEVPAALKLVGEQESELNTLGAGAASPTCVDRVTPLRLAVTVAV